MGKTHVRKKSNRAILPSLLFSRSKNMTEQDRYFQLHKAKETKERGENQRILITVPYGIGDAVYVGLSAVDQIVKNDPTAQVDILCNDLQLEIFSSDPRIHAIIVAEQSLFPTSDNFTILKALTIDPKAEGLLKFLKEQSYDAVLPGNVAFRFLHALGTRVLYPTALSALQDYQTIRNFGDAPASRRIRAIINRYFGNKLPSPQVGEPITLYMNPEYIKNAKIEIANLEAKAKRVGEENVTIIVAPDTTSSITRPPTELLTNGIAPILEEQQKILVYILPSFTDGEAAQRLYKALFTRFSERIQWMPSSPRPSLLFTAALIDQGDLLITGDTGIMHLTAAEKAVNSAGNGGLPRNKTKVIAIFGGTNPGLYGYHLRTTVLGRGNKEQQKLRPGFLKEGYDSKGRDYFSHISPDELTQAIRKELLITQDSLTTH